MFVSHTMLSKDGYCNILLLLQANEWRKFRAPKGVATPKGRRSHTATVYQDSLYIYGGYQDLKGSTSELWAFHFGKNNFFPPMQLQS